ncbi:MAG: hypothetical protein WKF79_00265 [Nocardioides sp.]
MLTGFKTYAVVAIALLTAVAGYITGEITLLQMLEAGGLAVALGGNRAVLKIGETLNSPFNSTVSGDPRNRQWLTYIGAAVTIISAVLAATNDGQELAVTVSAILAALGLNFLGLGAKKVVVPGFPS